MNFDEYQAAANRTAAEGSSDLRLAISGMGVAAEAGEVCDILKKWLGHGHQRDLDKLKSEAGDVLWYVADICSQVGLSMDDVADYNVNVKLAKRYKDGFSHKASRERPQESDSARPTVCEKVSLRILSDPNWQWQAGMKTLQHGRIFSVHGIRGSSLGQWIKLSQGGSSLTETDRTQFMHVHPDLYDVFTLSLLCDYVKKVTGVEDIASTPLSLLDALEEFNKASRNRPPEGTRRGCAKCCADMGPWTDDAPESAWCIDCKVEFDIRRASDSLK